VKNQRYAVFVPRAAVGFRAEAASVLLSSDSAWLPMFRLQRAGWLIPGAGHLMLRKWVRGGLLMVSIVAMFVIGLALKGKVYTPNTGDLLDILNFAGDLGNGLLYVLARIFDLGAVTVQVATADYGTKFMVVAGLLNIISAVDAHSLATGRKRS
jgi:hypothetical protein